MSPTNADIMRELGGLTAEMKHASESRGVIHQKLEAQNVILDETTKTLAKVGFALQVTTDVAVQARDRIAHFEADFREHQMPVIAEAARAATVAAAFKLEAEPILNTMKTVRNIVVALLGLGILSAGSAAVLAFTARDWLAAGIRWVLGI